MDSAAKMCVSCLVEMWLRFRVAAKCRKAIFSRPAFAKCRLLSESDRLERGVCLVCLDMNIREGSLETLGSDHQNGV